VTGLSALHARLAIGLLVLSLMVVIGGCIEEKNDLQGLLGVDPSEVTKISFRCGTTGDLVTVEEEEGIQEFLAILTGKTFQKAKDQALRTGYRFYADFFQDDKELLRVTFLGDQVSIKQIYYDVSPTIPSEELDAFLARHK
jgi:hypothetical protein